MCVKKWACRITSALRSMLTKCVIKSRNKFDCEARMEALPSLNGISKAKTLDPGLRQDDDLKANSS